MTQTRVLFEEAVPYEVPTSLEALRGPGTGKLTLPLRVWWGPSRTFDLEDPTDVLVAYRSLIREGAAADHEALLDRQTLLRTWRHLQLPARCRRVWEQAFAELRT